MINVKTVDSSFSMLNLSPNNLLASIYYIQVPYSGMDNVRTEIYTVKWDPDWVHHFQRFWSMFGYSNLGLCSLLENIQVSFYTREFSQFEIAIQRCEG